MHSIVASDGLVDVSVLFIRDIVRLEQLLEVFERATVDREFCGYRPGKEEGTERYQDYSELEACEQQGHMLHTQQTPDPW